MPALQVRAAPYTAGQWPLDVSVTPDQSRINLGEPAWLSFTVRNLSPDDLQILVGGDTENDLGRPASFQIKTVRSDGKWILQPDAGERTGGLIGPKDLPAGGTYVFRLFVPHWATIKETGRYTINCHRTLQLLRAGDNFRQHDTIDVVADARTTLDVHPPNAGQMGELIRELGETMLRANGDRSGDEAVVSLAWIDDPRVVPYFRRAFALRSYAMKFIAVQIFGRFTTDDAFEGLKAAMQAGAGDFDSAQPEHQRQLAADIRGAAAHALQRSKHPQARAFLVAQRRDESESVRLTVLHAAARLPPAEGAPILQEMSRDRSERVRDEATRILAVVGLRPKLDPPR